MNPEDQYAQEQAQLQGGEEEGDGLHIDLPQTPEVRAEVYRDVEPLLFRGFLYQSASINDVPFVFKSLNHHEFEMLSLLDTRSGPKGVQHTYNLFLAYGVFMVGGCNVLQDRDHWIPEIADMFAQLEEGSRKKVIFHLSEINRRAAKAVVLSEAYAQENQSRLRWAQLGQMDFMSPSVTGIVGTNQLGANWAQLAWRAMNYYEDQRELAEREWENTKFAASAMAGKGMTKVHEQDKKRRKTEQEEKAKRKDKILRFAVLGEPMEEDSAQKVTHVARTVEELATQLKNDLKGEKDFHDRIVDSVQDKIQNERNQRLVKIRELRDVSQARYGDRPLIGETSMAGLTPDEVKFRIERRRQLNAQRMAAQTAFPELHDQQAAEFAEKWASVSHSKPVTVNNPSIVAPMSLSEKPRMLPITKGDD